MVLLTILAFFVVVIVLPTGAVVGTAVSATLIYRSRTRIRQWIEDRWLMWVFDAKCGTLKGVSLITGYFLFTVLLTGVLTLPITGELFLWWMLWWILAMGHVIFFLGFSIIPASLNSDYQGYRIPYRAYCDDMGYRKDYDSLRVREFRNHPKFISYVIYPNRDKNK